MSHSKRDELMDYLESVVGLHKDTRSVPYWNLYNVGWPEMYRIDVNMGPYHQESEIICDFMFSRNVIEPWTVIERLQLPDALTQLMTCRNEKEILTLIKAKQAIQEALKEN